MNNQTLTVVSRAIEGTLNDWEGGIVTKEEAIRHLTEEVIQWVFQESCSWAAQVQDVQLAARDLTEKLSDPDAKALYSEMRANLNKRIQLTFKLAVELEDAKKRKEAKGA